MVLVSEIKAVVRVRAGCAVEEIEARGISLDHPSGVIVDNVDQDSDSLEVEEFYDRLQLIALDREFALR